MQLKKHAYLIMAHADVELLKALISMLDDERNDIYLHIDKKWKDFEAKKLHPQHSRLYILEERIDVRWGSRSIMDAEYALYKASYKHDNYQYYHMLSGADLPIKSQDYIHSLLSKAYPQALISYWHSSRDQKDAVYKAGRYHFLTKYERPQNIPRVLSILLAKFRFMISDVLYYILGNRSDTEAVYKGANWSTLPDTCVRILLDHEQALKKRFRFTRNPDELFAQTILAKHYFHAHGIKLPTEENDLRYTLWQKDAISPDTLRMSDIPQLLNSSALFARKFSSTIDSDVVRWVTQTYSNK